MCTSIYLSVSWDAGEIWDARLRIWKGMEHRARGVEYEARREQGSEVRSQRADGSKY